MAWMRVRMRRRSVSSLVSPGPRVPMPPPSRDSAVPAPDQPRQQVLQLRQLHLQLAFPRARAPGEDVEDELRAIDDLAADRLFDVPQLRRRQLVVEDDDVDVGFGGRRAPASAILPAPRNVDGSGFGRSCSTRSTTSAPAASARPASSSSDRSASSRRARPAIEPDQRRALAPLSRPSGVEPCQNLFPRNRAGAHQRRRRAVTSTIVDGGAAGRRARCRSAGRCDRPASARPRRDRPSPAAPLRFALVAVTGRPASRGRSPAPRRGPAPARRRVRFRRSRRAPAPRGAATSSVSGPGQNASASRAATRRQRPRCAATCAASAAISGSARSAARPFTANTRATAAAENGSAARPYSVSVGSATMPPLRIHFAASSIASRCGAPGSTNTRRISLQSVANGLQTVPHRDGLKAVPYRCPAPSPSP